MNIKEKLDRLNEAFGQLPYFKRVHTLYSFFEEKDVLLTSSFGANSIFLLDLFNRYHPSQTVHFINTGYHFEETMDYKREIDAKLGLKVVEVRPDRDHHHFSRKERLWKSDPNLCCTINKVMPLEQVKGEYKVWVSGVMGWQTPYRKSLNIFEWQDGMIKFHPLIDIDEQDFLRYSSFFKLPQHPLQKQGYASVGCSHCTKKGKGRSGRWQGKNKTECGLHLPNPVKGDMMRIASEEAEAKK